MSTLKKKSNQSKNQLNKGIIKIDKQEYSALELYQNDIEKVPKLLDPFLQTVGLASLVGTSDGGKSTFLRQLALSIVTGMDNFLGYKLNPNHKRVIYVSTEEDPISVSPSIKKQIKHFKDKKLLKDENDLEKLLFIFDTNDLYDSLKKKLENNKVDLVIIDAFTDIFTKEINANTQVRNFLNSYDRLAKKHRCLIIFLHHIGKRRDKGNPSKDSIIGSQAFEAKMRVVLELRPRSKGSEEIDLWVLKSNFLQLSYKQRSYVLKFKQGSIFENTNKRTGSNTESKVNNLDIIKKVLALHKQKKSVREIEKELRGTDYEVSKSTAQTIISDNKK